MKSPMLPAMEYEVGLEILESYLSRTRYLDSYQSQFSYAERSNLIALGPNAFFELNEAFSGYFRGYAYWEHYFKDYPSEINDVDLYISDAYIEYENRRWSTRLGIQHLQFGRGLIFADDAIAATFHLDGYPVYFDVYGAKVMDNSPMMGGSIGYRFDPFQKVEAFALYFKDQDNAYARAAEQYLSATDLANEGFLSWFGLSAEFFIQQFYLTALGVYQSGQMDFSRPREQFNRQISAFMFDLGIQVNLTNRFSMGLFCFMASGDEAPLRDDLTAFISPLPYNTRASIFFDPAFMDVDETSSLIFGGTTSKGVIAPGLTVNLLPLRDLLIEGKVLSFYPQFKSSNNDAWYGWEADLLIRYRLKNNAVAYMEIARFEHGNFFEILSDAKPESAFRFIIGGRVNLTLYRGFR